MQRTCHARLFGGNDAAWFLFWGYQFFIVMAALGYVLGITQSKPDTPSRNGTWTSG